MFVQDHHLEEQRAVGEESANRKTGYPIRIVAQRTGLTTPVIRAWERRYGTVTPARSEAGQRVYSEADLERLQ
ncbi:MAG: MerR family transcriptional regulator, partial [Longimicrobiales bacterium]